MPEITKVSSLYRKFGATIYSRCRRLLGDDARAAEAAVDAFTRAFPELLTAPDDASALRCVYRACDAACADHQPLRRCG